MNNKLYNVLIEIKNYIVNLYNNLMPYITYIFKRVLLLIPVFIIITMIIFFMVSSMPGDPLAAYMDQESIPQDLDPEVEEQRRQELLELYGLNDPIPVRYVNWWKDFFNGDYGYSSIRKQPVNTFIEEAFMYTLKINVYGFAIAFILGIIIGITSAVKKNKLFDKVSSVVSVIGFSMPSFFFAMILLYVFAINLKVLPLSGSTDPKGVIPDWHYMVLPIMLVAITSTASIMKYVRSAMLEVLKQDYIRTARSKGLNEKVVIYKHAFRNSMIPVITLLGFYIPALFGGSIITEKIFNYPGIGLLMSQAYTARDSAILTIVLTFFAFLTLLGNLFMDVGYTIVDPRISVGGNK